MRFGWGLGIDAKNPSLGDAPNLSVFDSETRASLTVDNPGKYIPPGQGKRPRAVLELAAMQCDVLLVWPESLCGESYHLARERGMRFIPLTPDDDIADTLADANKRDARIVETLPDTYYPD